MVPGAKLREHMVRAGDSAGFDVVDYVANSGMSFSQLVARIAGVTIETRPGSDVVIGLDGARVPDQAARHRYAKQSKYGGLRSDVYQAFTRFPRSHTYFFRKWTDLSPKIARKVRRLK